MDKFLHQQAAEGEADSAGVFTIAWARRRQKLRRFQEGYPAFYLLKLYQAAYCCRPEEIRIQLESNQVILEFDLPQARPELEPENLRALLERDESYPRGLLHHLLTGLNAAALAGQRASWACSSGTTLRWNSDGLEVQTGDAGFKLLGEGVRYRFRLKRPESQREREKEALLKRCCYGVVPLSLNHGKVHPRWPKAQEADWHRPYLAACDVIRYFECGQPSLRLPRVNLAARRLQGEFWLHSRAKSSLDKTLAVAWSEPAEAHNQGPYEGAYLLSLALEGPSTLLFIKDGVLLDPFHLSGVDFGARALLSGDQIQVDLSEFGVLQGQDLSSPIGRVRETWSRLLASALENVGSLPQIKGRGLETSSWGGLELLPGLDFLWGLLGLVRMVPVYHDSAEQAHFQTELVKRLEAAQSQLK